MTVAAAGLLPSNLFSVADSDFESALTGNWTGIVNCTLSQSSAQQFTGGNSLRAAATASGSMTFQYIKVPVTAGLGYTLSWWAYATAAALADHISVIFRNASNTQVGSTLALPAFTLSNGAWVPHACQFSPAATAVSAQFSLTTTGSSATEGTYYDLFYCAQTVWQCLGAWTSLPLSTSPQWADMTPWLRADAGISCGHGRPDEVSTVQAGAISYVLDNSQGWFAEGNAGTPFPGLAVGKRTQLNACDETGVFHTRGDAYLTDVPATWNGGPGLESVVTVSGQDATAWLARQQSMRTMIEQECLLDNASVLYVLDDPQHSTTAADSSGNAAPPLKICKLASTGVAVNAPAFGSSTGIIGALAPGYVSSPLQSLLMASSSPVVSYQLQALLPSPVTAAAGFSLGIWCDINVASCPVSAIPICVANSKTGAFIGVTLNGGLPPAVIFYASITAGSGASTGASNLPTPIQHFVVTVSGTTATLYVNGISQATITVPAGFTADTIIVAGAPGGLPSNGIAGDPAGVAGNLNLAAVFPAALTSTRVTAHWTAGSQQNWGAKLSTLVGNILNYSGIPAALQSIGTTTSYADAYEITGQSPLSMLQLYQQVDGGVFYCSAGGVLTWQPRVARYGAQVTPALILAPGQYETPLPFGPTTQFMVNDATYGNVNIPGGVRAINTAGKAANGTYPSGAPGSPTTGPWYSYPWQPNSTTYYGVAPPDSDVLTDAVQWETNIYGTPVPRSPSVLIELASQAAGPAVDATLISRATAYGVEVGSVIEVTGLPASAPAGTRVNFLMVEGVTETFKRDDSGVTWTLEFNTSPASQSAAWIAGDANMGILDSTAVVGRGTDGATQALPGPAQYAGPPYPVPAFSSGMNATGNVGANDMRGLAANVQLAVTPPIFMVTQVHAAQSIGNNAAQDVQWDTIWYDSVNGWAALAVAPNLYVVQVPGIYDLMASVPLSGNTTGDRRAYFQQNGVEVAGRSSIQAIAGTDFVSLAIFASIQCSAGDTLKVTAFQNSGVALAIPTTDGGATWSGTWAGN